MPPEIAVTTVRKSQKSVTSSEQVSGANDLSLFTIPQFENSALASSCGSDPYLFYNIPRFTEDSWMTASTPAGYEWHLDYNDWVTFTNRPSIASYVSANYPLQLVKSSAYTALTNDLDQYGDPEAHTITFWYEYFLSNVSVDTIKVSVGYTTFWVVTEMLIQIFRQLLRGEG